MTADSRSPALVPARRLLGGASAPVAGLRSTAAVAGIAAGLAIAPLIPWIEPPAAARTGAFAALLAAIGLAFLRSGRFHGVSPLGTSALALVLSTSIISLGALALALARLPITPATVLALMLAAAALAGTSQWRARRSPAPVASGEPIEASGWTPSRATVIGCVALSAPALLVLPGWIDRLALAIYLGALARVLWPRAAGPAEPDTSIFDEDPPGRRPRSWSRFARWLPVALLGLLLLSRLAPFVRSSVPLGYDTGLYRAVQADFVAALPGIPEFAARSWGVVQPPGLFVLSDLLSLAGVSADGRLWGLLILTQLVAAIGVWLLAFDAAGRRAAGWALAFFVISSAQYMLYFQVYFKQALALALLPFALWLWRRNAWLAVPVGAFLAATHTMGFLLLGLILLSDFLWLDRIPSGVRGLPRALVQRRGRLGAGVAILLLGLAPYAFAPRAIGDYLTLDLAGTLARFGVGAEASAGSYRFDTGYYALLVLALMPFAALTVVRAWRLPQLRLVLLWAIWAGGFVVLDLVFARRFIGSLDPALIVLASVSIAQLSGGSMGRQLRPFLAIAVLAGTIFSVRTIHGFAPAIPIEDLRDLQAASRSLPADAYLMAVSGADSPWIRGYGGRDTIAPGFLERDRWTRDEWLVFWYAAEARERYELLARYERPIYVFMRSGRVLSLIADDPQFERVSRTLWRYIPPADAGEEVRAPPSGARPVPAGR